MTLDVLSAEKINFRDTRKPWIVDRSDGIVINYRVSNPINRTEVEPYFESSYPFMLLRHKGKNSGAGPFKPNRPRIPLTTVGLACTEVWEAQTLRQSRFIPSPPRHHTAAAPAPGDGRHGGRLGGAAGLVGGVGGGLHGREPGGAAPRAVGHGAHHAQLHQGASRLAVTIGPYLSRPSTYLTLPTIHPHPPPSQVPDGPELLPHRLEHPRVGPSGLRVSRRLSTHLRF